MRHRCKKVKKFSSGVQKKDLVIRNLMTSLIEHGEIVTTEKKARILKYSMERFMARLVRMFNLYKDEQDVKRESIRYVKTILFTDIAGKKVVEELLPKFKAEGRKSGFTTHYKLGFRPGDSAEKVLIKFM